MSRLFIMEYTFVSGGIGDPPLTASKSLKISCMLCCKALISAFRFSLNASKSEALANACFCLPPVNVQYEIVQIDECTHSAAMNLFPLIILTLQSVEAILTCSKMKNELLCIFVIFHTVDERNLYK